MTMPTHPALAGFTGFLLRKVAGASFEGLFVKNLEAVQGDERDVSFIAGGYGVAPSEAKPGRGVGGGGEEGGERRLNVLASRARDKCVVFSSITGADIPADSEARGTRMLRALLDFAETGKLGAGTLQPPVEVVVDIVGVLIG